MLKSAVGSKRGRPEKPLANAAASPSGIPTPPTMEEAARTSNAVPKKWHSLLMSLLHVDRCIAKGKEQCSRAGV
tara:strand:- start:287 stop:508 length:222 start_codon:yes stop_codon:yes gene_type:complete